MRAVDWLVGVFAEDVPDDHNGFLHDVIDLSLDEVQQSANTALSRLLYTQTEKENSVTATHYNDKTHHSTTTLQHDAQWKKAIRLLIEEKIFSHILYGMRWHSKRHIGLNNEARHTSTLIAQRPMARTAFRTKSTSTSVAYSFSSANTYGNQHHFKWISIEINCTSEMKGWMTKRKQHGLLQFRSCILIQKKNIQ